MCVWLILICNLRVEGGSFQPCFLNLTTATLTLTNTKLEKCLREKCVRASFIFVYCSLPVFKTDLVRPSACPRWTHGAGCSKECDCVQEHSSGCDPKTGSCFCKTAYHGLHCEKGINRPSTQQLLFAAFFIVHHQDSLYPHTAAWICSQI